MSSSIELRENLRERTRGASIRSSRNLNSSADHALRPAYPAGTALPAMKPLVSAMQAWSWYVPAISLTLM